MSRFIFPLILFLSSCTPSQLPPGDYYGALLDISGGQNNLPGRGKPLTVTLPGGFGGQYIFVVPELDLVVVFNGTNCSTDPKELYFEIIQGYIVKACE